ncbi:MAG: hypothetical protein KDN22_17645 [Verrucomicrobiae bacterium]|nr:hypothetical protein [Verrucomicrobiae bacterium]
MKLKDVIATLRRELLDAGVMPGRGTRIDLAVVLKKTAAGIGCEIVDGGSMSSIRPESVHRLVLALDERTAVDDVIPVAEQATEVAPKLPGRKKRVSSPFRMMGTPMEAEFVDDNNMDDPAIFRRAIPVEE